MRTNLKSSTLLATDNGTEIKMDAFIVPLARNKNFVGREDILEWLLARIPPAVEVGECQTTAITGIAGVGKTEVALQAVYRVHERYPGCSVFWVRADRWAAFESAYLEIGRALQIHDIGFDTTGSLDAVKTALEKSPSQWLLIFDDLDDSIANYILTYLPLSRQGSILFITRNARPMYRLGIATASILTIPPLSQHEANTMLCKLLKLEEHQLSDDRSAAELVEHLGRLPLAIQVISSNMLHAKITTADVLKHYSASEEAQSKLLSMGLEESSRYHDDHKLIPDPYLASFLILQQSDPLAADYLKFICFLNAEDIPISILPPGAHKFERESGVGVLCEYALISARPGFKTFTMHRLVQSATRDWIRSTGDWQECCTKVIKQLSKICPPPQHENRHLWKDYLPHVLSALESSTECTDKEAAASLSSSTAANLCMIGMYDEARQMYQKTLELLIELRGLEHPDTLSTMEGLAIVLRHQEKYDEAEQIHQQVLPLRKKILGPKHPDTLSSLDNLTQMLSARESYEEAEEVFRSQVQVAIICALTLETDAVQDVFDRRLSEVKYGKRPGDPNHYTMGAIGHHDVVLVHMPVMEKRNGATVAANCRASFPSLELVLVVGICGGMPFTKDGNEIILGDIAVSDGLIQYDFGRQFPDRFIRKNDNMPKPNAEILSFLAKMKGRGSMKTLRERTALHLQHLSGASDLKEIVEYPGALGDRLYEPTYRHKHQVASDCEVCDRCRTSMDPVCEDALRLDCKTLQCSDQHLIARERLAVASEERNDQNTHSGPSIHFGLYASGDKVIKSGEERDVIAKEEGVIAFEMEGSGVWEVFPGRCLVVKAVCDYADGHKNKVWQSFAAASAAACTKALLKSWPT